jgi:hypothetical protein
MYWQDFYTILGDASGDIPGDVNGDGEVNVADANSVIHVIINGGSGGHTRAPIDGDDNVTYLEDVNLDGEINIADVNLVINYILNH